MCVRDLGPICPVKKSFRAYKVVRTTLTRGVWISLLESDNRGRQVGYKTRGTVTTYPCGRIVVSLMPETPGLYLHKTHPGRQILGKRVIAVMVLAGGDMRFGSGGRKILASHIRVIGLVK